MRADAVGYAVTTLLSTASAAEQVSNQYQVGLYPFIQYLYGCTSVTPCSASNAYVPLTTNLTGSTITNAAANLASLLDTGDNSNLGSGGTHFENALSSMNSLISSVGTGAGSSNALPYVFIITDGSEDYQTQWLGDWASENWSSDRGGPVSEFVGGHPAEQRHDNRLLHQHQEARHHHRDPLYSLSAHPGSQHDIQ